MLVATRWSHHAGKRQVYPVAPDTVSVQGVRAYASVTDIPDPVDLAVVTEPAAGPGPGRRDPCAPVAVSGGRYRPRG